MKEIYKLYKEIKRSNKYFKKGDILTVSNYGKVKCNGEFYKCPIVGGRYYYLCHRPLHRIIAEKFLSDWDPNKEVDHKDRNTLNNMVTNLLLCDHTQNMNNPLTIQYRKEIQNNPITIQHYREGHPTKPVLQYTKDNKFMNEFISIREASRQTKISDINITQCCKHRRKSAGGYIWRYKKED